MSNKLEEVSKLLRGRRSIFPNMFTGERVSQEVIMTLLENANSAPSHKNTEPWRFRVISPDKLDSFADFFQAVYTKVNVGEAFVQRKYDSIRKKILNSSHIIILSMLRDPKASVPEWEEIAATACAIQNIYLSLPAAGLGGYWSSPNILIDNITDFTELIPEERCLGLFYVGVPKEDLPPPIEKKPLAGKVCWL